MLRNVVLAMLFSGPLQGPALSRSAMGQSEKEIAHAAVVFGRNCVKCHQAPDTKFAADRAWLTQVKETS